MVLKIALLILSGIIVITAIVYAYLAYVLRRVPKAKADGIRVACVGDSITQGVGVLFDHMSWNSYPALLQELLGDQYQVLNYGHTGRTLLKSGDMPYHNSPFFAASQIAVPAIVLLMLGTNDSKPQNWNAVEYEEQLIEMVELYKHLPSHPVVYLLIPPAAFIPKGKSEVAFRIRDAIIEKEVVPIVKRVAERTNTPIIDIYSATKEHPAYFPDGVHPNAMGNKAIADTIFAALSE